MSILAGENVTKIYGDTAALDSVDFQMPEGKIFGLLGPNGAGKTTLIRIITSIIKADQGRIMFEGEPLDIRHPEMIGYMPEERGLYKKMKVGDQLLYLSQLKGLDGSVAREKIQTWLKRFDIEDWWDKKIDQLSKGMQQKIQFISTVAHDPKLIILDEPFSGLDPVNTNLIKEEIRRLHGEGTNIIFSTHRMEQVEEICEHIMLIHKGRKLLQGDVMEIRHNYKENLFRFDHLGSLPADILNGELIVHKDRDHFVVQLDDAEKANEYMKHLLEKQVVITAFNEIMPTLNEVFIKVVSE